MKIKNEKLKQFLYLIFGLLIFFLYFKIIPGIFRFIYNNFIHNPGKIFSNIFLSIMEITVFVVLFLIFRKTITNDFKKFKNDYKKNLDIGFKYYFVGMLVMIVSNLILMAITGGIAENEAVNREYLKMYPLYSVIAMVFMGPPIEEIVFRLGFRKAFKKWLPYAIFSGVFFGGLHALTAFEGMTLHEALKNWINILYTIPYGALGFAFAKAYYETDNICTSALIHIIHNGFTVLLILVAMR